MLGDANREIKVFISLGYQRRRFLTREEVIAQLEEYLKNLQAEARGVEERIAELRKMISEG